MNRILRLYAFLLPLLAAVFVFEFGVNVPYWDEFEFAGMMSGGPGFWKYITAPHNEHVMPLGKLAYYALARLTSMDSKAMMYLSVIILSIPYLLLVRRIRTHDLMAAAATVLIFFTAFFSPRSCVNLLWGFQPPYLAAFSFGILAILSCDWFLRTRNGWHLLAASLCCTAASLCSAHGLLSWVSVALAAIYSRQFRKCLASLAPAAIIAACYLVSARHFPPAAGGGGVSPAGSVRYFLTFLSGHLLFNARAGWVTGLAALTIAAYLVLRKNAGSSFLFVSLAAFGVLIAAAVSFGRSRFGLEESLTSRYFQLQMPLFLAFGVYLAEGHHAVDSASAGPGNPRRFAAGSCLVLLTVLGLASYNTARGMQSAAEFREERLRGAEIMRDSGAWPCAAAERYLYPNCARARRLRDFLKAEGLSLFASGHPAAADGTRGGESGSSGKGERK